MVGELGPGSAGRAHPCARAARSLDITADKCALPPYVERVYCRSGWDRRGGGRSRHEAHRKVFLGSVTALERGAPAGLRPFFVTLTIDRAPFMAAHPEEVDAARDAFHQLGDKVRFFCRRCGVKWWIKALEWQSFSGAGWAHWHLVMFFPAQMSTADVRRLIWARWAGVGGGRVDVQPAYRKNGRWDNLAGYLAKYVMKGMEVVPPVLDHPDFVMAPRAYSMSKAMSSFVRERGPGKARRFKTYRDRDRVLRPIYQRLAESGTRMVVVQEVIDPETGECRPDRRGRPIRMPARAITLAQECGLLGKPVQTFLGRTADGLRHSINGGADALERFWEVHGEAIDAWWAEEVRCNAEAMRWHWEEHQRKRQEASAGRNPPGRSAATEQRRDAARTRSAAEGV